MPTCYAAAKTSSRALMPHDVADQEQVDLAIEFYPPRYLGEQQYEVEIKQIESLRHPHLPRSSPAMATCQIARQILPSAPCSKPFQARCIMSSMKTSNSCTNKPQMLADRSSLQNRRRRSVQMRAQEGEKTEVGARNSDSITAFVLLTKTFFLLVNTMMVGSTRLTVQLWLVRGRII